MATPRYNAEVQRAFLNILEADPSPNPLEFFGSVIGALCTVLLPKYSKTAQAGVAMRTAFIFFPTSETQSFRNMLIYHVLAERNRQHAEGSQENFKPVLEHDIQPGNLTEEEIASFIKENPIAKVFTDYPEVGNLFRTFTSSLAAGKSEEDAIEEAFNLLFGQADGQDGKNT